MAALDFPASPTVGQVFAAPNGVSYQWNGTLWLATVAGTTPGGDFCAILGTGPAINATPLTLIPTTIISGNAGSHYNTANGRWTPPAGRYAVECGFCGNNTTGGLSNLIVGLLKNGTQLIANNDGSPSAYSQANPRASLIVDANGTDWFIMQGWSDLASSTSSLFFQAFPISGIKGPPGDLAAPTGLISDFAGAVAPSGWLLCNGASISRATYAGLFAVIGTTYGSVDGNTFSVPDLRGRVTAGIDGGSNRLHVSVGTTLGAVGGAQNHQLLGTEVPSHVHSITWPGAAGTTPLTATGGQGNYGNTEGTSGGNPIYYSNPGTTDAYGSNGYHNITQPTIMLNKIIRT